MKDIPLGEVTLESLNRLQPIMELQSVKNSISKIKTMTAEQFVKSLYPHAQISSHVAGMIKGMQSKYYLVWTNYASRQPIRLGEGDTKSKAWVNAKKSILENK